MWVHYSCIALQKPIQYCVLDHRKYSPDRFALELVTRCMRIMTSVQTFIFVFHMHKYLGNTFLDPDFSY